MVGVLDEETVKNNFSLVYHVLDGTYYKQHCHASECCDFGYPQEIKVQHIIHKKNQVFLDVVEYVDHSRVRGVCTIKSFLSGDPYVILLKSNLDH